MRTTMFLAVVGLVAVGCAPGESQADSDPAAGTESALNQDSSGYVSGSPIAASFYTLDCDEDARRDRPLGYVTKRIDLDANSKIHGTTVQATWYVDLKPVPGSPYSVKVTAVNADRQAWDNWSVFDVWRWQEPSQATGEYVPGQYKKVGRSFSGVTKKRSGQAVGVSGAYTSVDTAGPLTLSFTMQNAGAAQVTLSCPITRDQPR